MPYPTLTSGIGSVVVTTLLAAACMRSAPAIERGTNGSARPVASDTSATMDEARRIDAHLQSLVPWGFSGNVLVARRDTVILARGYGLANREQGLPFTAQSQVHIGSIVKDFTKAAIAALESDGLLRTTDSLHRFFPDLPPDKGAITLQQLLTHTSGLPMGVGEHRTRDEFLRELASRPLASPVGERFIYSNAGYSVLAAIIEELSGTDFESFVRSRFLLKNGIRETGFHFVAWDSARVGHTYDRSGVRAPSSLSLLRAADPRAPWGRQGAGAWFSTLEDLYRWSRVTPVRPNRNFEPGQSWGVLGGTDTYETAIRYFPADSLTVVMHNNVNGSLSEHLSLAVGRIALGLPVGPSPPPPQQGAVIAASLEGRYTLPSGGTITAVRQDELLALVPTGQDAYDAVFGAPADRLTQRQSYSARTDSIIRATLGGDWSALGEVVPPPQRASAAARFAAQRQGAAEGLGPLKSHRVVGVTSTAMGGHAIVELSYERGRRYERVGWAGPRVALYQQETAPPAAVVRPARNGGFVHFDLATGVARIFTFAPASGSAPPTLQIPTAGGNVVASRIGPHTAPDTARTSAD